MTNKTISRRRFLKYTGLTLGGMAAGTYGVSTLNRADYSDPAYTYWRHKVQSGMSDNEYIVMCGTLAPSPHNTQPWKFKPEPGVIKIFADKSRSLGAADPDFKLMAQGMGCALENMKIAALKLGYKNVTFHPEADSRFQKDGYCGALKLNTKSSSGNHSLHDSIFIRQTIRSSYNMAHAIPDDFIMALSNENNLPDIHIKWFKSPGERAKVVSITKEAIRLFIDNDSMYRDGMKWFRLKRDEWETKRDGISIFTSNAPFYIKHWFEWVASRQDLNSDTMKESEVGYIDHVAPLTPLWGLIYSDVKSYNNRIYGGQMLEKVYLRAAKNGYGVCPLSQPTDMKHTDDKLRELTEVGQKGELLTLFRLGKADMLEKSVRLDLSKVII